MVAVTNLHAPEMRSSADTIAILADGTWDHVWALHRVTPDESVAATTAFGPAEAP